MLFKYSASFGTRFSFIYFNFNASGNWMFSVKFMQENLHSALLKFLFLII